MPELYLFDDNGVYHGFTPTLTNKELSGITYIPTIISRSGLNITDNFGKSPVSFKFERSHSYAKELLYYIPEIPITVTIYRDGLPYWKGAVIDTKQNGGYIEVMCDALNTVGARQGQVAKMTINCRHLLYSTNCGVLKEDWADTYTATASSTEVTVPGIIAADGYYSGGIAEMNGQKRHIRKHVGTTITLASPFTGVLTGNIILYPGCGLTEAACTAFNNLDNFGGFERLPSKNPFSNTGLL